MAGAVVVQIGILNKLRGEMKSVYEILTGMTGTTAIRALGLGLVSERPRRAKVFVLNDAARQRALAKKRERRAAVHHAHDLDLTCA